MTNIPCSTPLLTLNSKPHLEKLLPLLVASFTDVCIMDGNSTDGTQEYARSLGVRVLKQFETDEPNQRIANFTEMRRKLWATAQEEWLFLLDSDEIPTSEMIELVRRVVAENDTRVAHRIARKIQLVDGRVIDHAFCYPDLSLRLFARTSGIGLAERAVHERFVVPPEIRVMDHDEAILCPWPSLDVLWQKNRYYADLEGKRAFPSFAHLFRWVILYNLKTQAGIVVKTIRSFYRSWRRGGHALPLPYVWVHFWYRFQVMSSITRSWMRQKKQHA